MFAFTMLQLGVAGTLNPTFNLFTIQHRPLANYLTSLSITFSYKCISFSGHTSTDQPFLLAIYANIS